MISHKILKFCLKTSNCPQISYIQDQQLILNARGVRQEMNERVIICKMEIWKKIFYALFVSLLCFSITKGDPRRLNALKNMEITDERLEYIMETTIAVQTKTIRQRITVESDGFWKLIPYMDTKRWAEIEVQLKTRIGIKLDSITYDKAYNHVHINFGGPSVLDRSYKTKVIETSNGFFSQSWTIQSFEQHKDIFLSELVDNQSNDIVDIFRKDQKQVNALQNQLQNKVLTALSSNYNALDPEVLVMKMNQYVLNKVGQFISTNLLPSINSSAFYTKQISNKLSTQRKQKVNDEKSEYEENRNKYKQQQQRYQSNRNAYKSEKELTQRQKLKKKMFQR